MKKICILMLAVISAAMFSSCTKTESSSVVDYKVSVVFNALGGTFDGEATTFDTTVNVGTEVKAPAVTPTRDGYIFVDWYLEGDCLTRAKFPVSVNSDKIYYAKWAPVGSQWRVSAMTVETYGVDQGILSPFPSSIFDYEYHFGNDGDLDSISISHNGANVSISFEGDSIYVKEDTQKLGIGTFAMENGSFSSFEIFAENDTLTGKDMVYDEIGYFNGMDMHYVGNTVLDMTLFDVTVENGTYRKFLVEIPQQSIVSMECHYQYSDIPNMSNVNAFSPGFAFFVLMGVDDDAAAWNIGYAIMSSSCVGKASDFIPRTVSLSMSASTFGIAAVMSCILDSQYTVINPLTGNISQLGYVGGMQVTGTLMNTQMTKFKYNYEPIE